MIEHLLHFVSQRLLFRRVNIHDKLSLLSKQGDERELLICSVGGVSSKEPHL